MTARTSDGGLKVQDLPRPVCAENYEADAKADGMQDAPKRRILAAEALLKSESKSKYWKQFLFVGVAFMIIQAGLMAGIVYGVVTASQKTKVQSNYLVSADGGSAYPFVAAPYAWRSDISVYSLVGMSDIELQSVAAIKVTVGGVSMVGNVSTITPANRPGGDRTIIITTTGAVVTITGTTIRLDWLLPELGEYIESRRGQGNSVGRSGQSYGASRMAQIPAKPTLRTSGTIRNIGRRSLTHENCGLFPLHPCKTAAKDLLVTAQPGSSASEESRQFVETDDSDLVTIKVMVQPGVNAAADANTVPHQEKDVASSALVPTDLPATRRLLCGAPPCCVCGPKGQNCFPCCCGWGANSVTTGTGGIRRTMETPDGSASAAVRASTADGTRSLVETDASDLLTKEVEAPGARRLVETDASNLVVKEIQVERDINVVADASADTINDKAFDSSSVTSVATQESDETRSLVATDASNLVAKEVEDLSAMGRSLTGCCAMDYPCALGDCCTSTISICCCGRGGNMPIREGRRAMETLAGSASAVVQSSKTDESRRLVENDASDLVAKEIHVEREVNVAADASADTINDKAGDSSSVTSVATQESGLPAARRSLVCYFCYFQGDKCLPPPFAPYSASECCGCGANLVAESSPPPDESRRLVETDASNLVAKEIQVEGDFNVAADASADTINDKAGDSSSVTSQESGLHAARRSLVCYWCYFQNGVCAPPPGAPYGANECCGCAGGRVAASPPPPDSSPAPEPPPPPPPSHKGRLLVETDASDLVAKEIQVVHDVNVAADASADTINDKAVGPSSVTSVATQESGSLPEVHRTTAQDSLRANPHSAQAILPAASTHDAVEASHTGLHAARRSAQSCYGTCTPPECKPPTEKPCCACPANLVASTSPPPAPESRRLVEIDASDLVTKEIQVERDINVAADASADPINDKAVDPSSVTSVATQESDETRSLVATDGSLVAKEVKGRAPPFRLTQAVLPDTVDNSAFEALQSGSHVRHLAEAVELASSSDGANAVQSEDTSITRRSMLQSGGDK